MKCPITRLRIGNQLDQGKALSASLEQHLRDCPECAAWFRTQHHLTCLLRRTLPESAEPPPCLQSKILRAIREHPAQPERRFPIRLAGAVAAIAVIAPTAFFLLLHPSQPTAEAVVREANSTHAPGPRRPTAGDVPALPLAVDRLTAMARFPDGRQILQAVATGLDQPLRRELTMLNQDAMSAFNALKTGFLPGSLFPEKR